jgi:hypothetical protein
MSPMSIDRKIDKRKRSISDFLFIFGKNPIMSIIRNCQKEM